MSVASEIQRLQTAKANLKTQIEAKGVTVPSATKIDGYPSLVASIPTGGGGGGVDIPVFTCVYDEDDVASFTCNKTFSECLALIDGDETATNNAAVYVEVSTELGEETFRYTCSATGITDHETYILYRCIGDSGLPNAGQFLYESDGTLHEPEMSTAEETLFVRRNGDYYPDYESGNYIGEVISTVPGSPVFGHTTKKPSSASNSIQFSSLRGEPTSFVIVAEGSLSTGSSPYKTAAVVFDGANVFGQYVTNVSNSEMTFSSSAFSKSYSSGGDVLFDNGTLTVTGVGTNFQQNIRYGLYYTYGGVSANIQTKQVQVGSGATSITFTGLTEEPMYWSCMFLGNIGTSSGYTRAHVVLCGEEGGTGNPKTIRGMEMGSESIASSQHWTASYNNGSLTITSTSSSAGGYFHQPGYYQLTYAVAEPVIPVVEPLSVTANGTYSADGKAYSPVVVNVSGGGGGGSAPKKQINFIDYDGTILYSYTKAEINAMTSESDLPANPSHSGLTSQGWNWTLAQIKAQLTTAPDADVWVGQMYITESGKTEIDVHFPDSARLSPIMTIAVNGTVTVDWGDNTTPDTVTGTSLTRMLDVPHTYANTGEYTIKITVASGNFTFYGSSSYTLLRKNTTANESRVYANTIQAVRLGSGVTNIGTYAFQYCYSLASVTIPSGVTSIGTYAFYYCSSLASVTIPSGVTSVGGSTFNGCYSLASVTIPSGVTSIGISAFNNCYSLASVTIPSGVTSIGNSTFNGCSSLASVTIHLGVTSVGNSTFYNCYSLASVTIPSGVTSIGNSTFNGCYGMAEYHIKPTTPPTLGTTVFNSIVSDCVIYVPSAKLSDYKAADNWSTYASYMQGE